MAINTKVITLQMGTFAVRARAFVDGPRDHRRVAAQVKHSHNRFALRVPTMHAKVPFVRAAAIRCGGSLRCAMTRLVCAAGWARRSCQKLRPGKRSSGPSMRFRNPPIQVPSMSTHSCDSANQFCNVTPQNPSHVRWPMVRAKPKPTVVEKKPRRSVGGECKVKRKPNGAQKGTRPPHCCCLSNTVASLLLPHYCGLTTAVSLLLPHYCCLATAASLVLLSHYCCLTGVASLLLPHYCCPTIAASLLLTVSE